MNKNIITGEAINTYAEYLRREERAENTIIKYLYDVREFSAWMAGQPVTEESVTAWKEHLLALARCPGTVNGSLAALHSFFTFMEWNDCRVKYLKMQRQGGCPDGRSGAK